MSALGLDVNPAAVYRARTAELMAIPVGERRSLLDKVGSKLTSAIQNYCEPTLFHQTEQPIGGPVPTDTLRRTVLSMSSRDERTIAFNVLMQAYGEAGTRASADELVGAYSRYAAAVSELPVAEAPIQSEQGDARQIPLTDGSIDVVLTSPPYINVFNYHQNYRRVVELIGHDLLSVARSEIGSNRKHRSNRLLTVIQYCLDMQLALLEIARVLRKDGTAIIVIGRESNVLGQRFENGRAIYALASICGLILDRRLERVFVSRYGPRVFEDILVLTATGKATLDADGARSVAESMLLSARATSADDSVLASIDAAINSLGQVQQSSRLLDARVC
jgi:hypothetical protein